MQEYEDAMARVEFYCRLVEMTMDYNNENDDDDETTLC